MSDFDDLQNVLRQQASERQKDERECERFLNALYQALRHTNGVGMPLNNVSMDMVLDLTPRLRPVPIGGFHAAWLRLGACEVFVRVRRQHGVFEGEYGLWGSFRAEHYQEAVMASLARQLLKDVARMYAFGEGVSAENTDLRFH